MDLRRGATALLALAVLAGPASGVDDTIAGRSLSLRQGRETSRLVLVVHAAVIAPLPGGDEDPTIHGAFVEISNPSTGEWARLAAPAAGWSMNPLGTVFRFRAPARGARPGLRSLVIRHGRRIKVKAATVGITLDEAAQGVLSASLKTGTRRYCMLFGGEVRRDEPGKFAARDAPAPSACPALPSGTTTTTVTTPAPPATTSTITGREPSSTSTTRRTTTSSTAPGATSTTVRVTTTSSVSSTLASTSSTRATTTSTSSSTSSTAAPDPMGPKKPKPPKK